MPRAYRPKPFDPKPFTPGAPIEWEHRTHDDRIVRRTGIVWSGASTGDRAGRAVWVTPDVALPGDGYRAIYVVVPPQRKAPYDSPMPYSGDKVDTGFGQTSPGWYTWRAAEAGRAVRAMNAERAALAS